MAEGYNGWSNYETWCCKLWMDNDHGSYLHWQERAQEAYDEAEACATFTRMESAALALKDEIKEQHEEAIPEGLESGFFADLLNAGLRSVDWYEIATSLIEEHVEEHEEV